MHYMASFGATKLFVSPNPNVKGLVTRLAKPGTNPCHELVKIDDTNVANQLWSMESYKCHHLSHNKKTVGLHEISDTNLTTV